jgi:L-alanine-DL-glutamate epimerase-like enolase superfamily enzyme
VLALAKDLARSLVGRQVHEVRSHWTQMWRRLNFIGHEGAPVMAVAALDVALWDLRARLAGLPLHAMLGARSGEWPVYASGGSLDLEVDALVTEATRAQTSGYAGFKCRVGGPDLATDIARVTAVREAVGDGFALMVDANQAWTRVDALRACQALTPLGLRWVEEPLDANDVAGLVELRRRVTVPIAAGETAYGVSGLHRLLSSGAVDVIQPDVMRCGGITPMLDVLALASAHHTTVMPHLYVEANAQLLGLLSTGAMIEYLPGWFEHLYGAPNIRDGRCVSPDAPGIGVELDRKGFPAIAVDMFVVALDGDLPRGSAGLEP